MVAEEQVGGRAGEEGEPVGGEPVGEDGEVGVAAVDAGQDQRATQAGFDKAEAAGGDRDERDDVGGGVGQQHQGGSGIGTGGAKGGEQAAEVKAEPARGQQGRLRPVLVQDGPDGVAIGQQPGVQAGERRAAATGDPVPEVLGGAAGCSQRPVRSRSCTTTAAISRATTTS